MLTRLCIKGENDYALSSLSTKYTHTHTHTHTRTHTHTHTHTLFCSKRRTCNFQYGQAAAPYIQPCCLCCHHICYCPSFMINPRIREKKSRNLGRECVCAHSTVQGWVSRTKGESLIRGTLTGFTLHFYSVSFCGSVCVYVCVSCRLIIAMKTISLLLYLSLVVLLSRCPVAVENIQNPMGMCSCHDDNTYI